MTKAHYSGSYARRARAIVARATADPLTRCWQCNRTAAEHGRPWNAGHVHDGQINGELRPECEQCNKSRGATAGNRRRIGLNAEQDW